MNFLVKHKYFEKYFVELLAVIALIQILFQFDLGWFNTHMSRDLLRAYEWSQLNFGNYLGPELGWDYKRLPGPLYYILLAPFMLIESLYFLVICKAFFSVGSIYLLTKEIQTRFPEKTLVFTLLFFISPLFIFSSRNLWNPSWVVAANCLIFYIFLKFEKTKLIKWQIYSLLMCATAIQIHFSSIIIYLAFTLTVFLSPQFSKKHKLWQFGLLSLLTLGLAAWFFLDRLPIFDQQISNLYGANNFFWKRFKDLNSFVSLYFIHLQDYNLFSFFARALNELDLFNLALNYKIVSFFSWTLLALFFSSLFIGFKKLYKSSDAINMFVIIHAVIFIISIFIVRNKPYVPYRYGLALFPIQFYLISTLISQFKNPIKNISVVFSFFVFLYFFYFNYKMVEAQQILGRTHSTFDDNLELTIRNKNKLYAMTDTNETGDPFNLFHGRTANRFRLKEFNWEQNKFYFSLYKLTTGRFPQFRPEMIEKEPMPGYLVQLKNKEQLLQNLEENILITPLKISQLPENLSITYYSKDNLIIETQNWKNTSLILPLGFITDIQKIDHINLTFTINSANNNYLNVLIDDNDKYFAYKPVFTILKVNHMNTDVSPLLKYSGNFLVQNQYIYKIENNKLNTYSIDLKINIDYNNYARIDIFATDSLLPQEEFFPNR